MFIVGSSRCAHVLPILVSRAGRASHVTCSSTADVSGESVIRSARANACRRIAAARHRSAGCNQAPLPGQDREASTETTVRPFPVDPATTRSSSTANSRFRQPMHVRTGPPVDASAAEFLRWTTIHSTVTAAEFRTKPWWRCAATAAERHPPVHRGLARGRGRRCGCRYASRSAGRPTERSGPLCRSPARAGNPAPSPGLSG